MEEKLRFAAENCRVADWRGFEPRVPFGTHAFQACTIDRSVTHPFTWAALAVYDRRTFDPGAHRAPLQSKLQPTEQFVERELDSNKEFAELAVFGAHRIEAHLVDDGFDLKRVAREQGHAPLGVVETGRAGDKLFHFTGELAANRGVALP